MVSSFLIYITGNNYAHIRGFKRNMITSKETPTKNDIIMDIKTWCEF